MLVYGRNVARDLLKKNKKIEKIILQEGFNDNEIFSLIEKNKIKYKYMSKKEIDNLAKGVHQGILLYVSDFKYQELNTVFENQDDFIVILDHLEDPHNLGAIIRTCEAASVKSIIMPRDRQVQINATVMKTSVGTLDNINIISVQMRIFIFRVCLDDQKC